MPLNLESKKLIVDEVSKIAGSALSAAAADYCGLTVGEMNTLRKEARSRSVDLRIVRNTLARRAVEGTEFECMRDHLTGPLVLAFSKDEPGAAARLFRDFAKKHDQLEVKLLAISGEAMGPENLKRVADLPSRDEALATLLSVMQAPVAKFVRTAAEPKAKFARVVNAVKEAKESQGES